MVFTMDTNEHFYHRPSETPLIAPKPSQYVDELARGRKMQNLAILFGLVKTSRLGRRKRKRRTPMITTGENRDLWLAHLAKDPQNPILGSSR